MNAHMGLFLDEVYRKYGRSEFLGTDPLPLVRAYTDPRDREVAGLLTALLSYGRVSAICSHARAVLETLGPSPRDALLRFDPKRDGPPLYPLRYRFHTGEDIASLFRILRDVLRSHGSVEALLHSTAGSIREKLSTMVRHLHSVHSVGGREFSYGLRFLLPSPDAGGACKRWNLYLRWMVRGDDGIDCGVWRGLSPADLVLPLDTHLLRIGRRLGFVTTRSASWEAAERFTAALREYDSEDPLRYDFALCRLGILDRCPSSGFGKRCRGCELLPFCSRATKGNRQKFR